MFIKSFLNEVPVLYVKHFGLTYKIQIKNDNTYNGNEPIIFYNILQKYIQV